MKTGLSTRQAADYLGLSQRTLANWRCYGQGPVYSRLGRLVRYEQGDLDAFIEHLRKDPSLTSAAKRRPARNSGPGLQRASGTGQAPDPSSTPEQRLPSLLKALSLGADLAHERLDHEKTRRELKLGRDKLLAAQQHIAKLQTRLASPSSLPQDREELAKLQIQLQAVALANNALTHSKAQIQSQYQGALLRLETATKANESLKAHAGQLQAQRDEAIGRLAQVPDVSALNRTIEELEGMLSADRTTALVFHLMTASTEALGTWYLQHVNPNGRPEALDTEKMRRRCLRQAGFKLIKAKLIPESP